MQDVTASDLPNADGFLRRSPLRVLAWVQAGLAQLHYGFLDWISLMSTPFTALAEYLEGWAAIAPTPVLRAAPTFAGGPVTWQGVAPSDLPPGTVCARDDGTQYETVADVTVGGGGSVTATIIALVAGSAGNTDSGAPFTLSSVIEGISPEGVASGPIVGGTDLELDPSLRSRMLESYAAPPHGGAFSDYVTWSLAIPGVTRAWVPVVPLVPGSVTVFFMMDAAEAAFGGFPQGTNGAATAETRAVTASGDQLTLANALFPLRPVTMIVLVVAPIALAQSFTLTGLTNISTAQKALVGTALAALLMRLDSPLNNTVIEQSDVDAAVTAIGGLPSFATTVPGAWPIASPLGSLFTLGTVLFP